MKFTVYCLAFLTCTSLFAQSKKELQAQVKQLQEEVAKLSTENTELKKPKPPAPLQNVKDSASYGIGFLLATNVKRQVGDTMNIEVLMQAMNDIFQGKSPKMDEKSCTMVIQASMQASMEKRSRKVKEESRIFLEENKKKPGVMTTATGLQYQIIAKGKGKAPKATSSVTVHYTGKLVDGTVFDSSVERGEPATFQLNEVISGWTEALQLMHEGDKWMIVLPSDLAYGERGSGPQIPPYSVLVFEVELIKVNN